MFCVLGVVALLVSRSIALDENEWTERIIKSFQDWTTYINGRDVDGLLSLYHEPMVEMIPGHPAMDRTAFEKFIRNRQKEQWDSHQLDMQFRELIYSTADMALARYVDIDTTDTGSKIIWKGVRMFLLQEDKTIKIRASIFNKD